MSKNLIIFIIGLMTSPFIVFSQNNNLFSGIVTDNEGNELIGATVYFEELGIGTCGLTVDIDITIVADVFVVRLLSPSEATT